MEREDTLTLEASDTTGQKRANFSDVPVSYTVGELVENVVQHLHLPTEDSQQQPISYQARLDREGRHLHKSERLGEALRTQDRISVHPTVSAGTPIIIKKMG